MPCRIERFAGSRPIRVFRWQDFPARTRSPFSEGRKCHNASHCPVSDDLKPVSALIRHFRLKNLPDRGRYGFCDGRKPLHGPRCPVCHDGKSHPAGGAPRAAPHRTAQSGRGVYATQSCAGAGALKRAKACAPHSCWRVGGAAIGEAITLRVKGMPAGPRASVLGPTHSGVTVFEEL